MDAEHRNGITGNKEQVKENRLILRRFINIVGLLGKQEFLFRGRDESPTALRERNAIGFLNVLENRGPRLENFVNSATFIEFQIKIYSLYHKISRPKIK